MTVKVLGRRLPAAATYAAALSAALILLILVVAGAFGQSLTNSALNEDVRQSIERRSHLRLLMRAMQDAETGQRGYLLTGDEAYLEPYLAGLADVRIELDAVSRQAHSTETRLEAAQLRNLVDLKVDEMDRTVNLRRTGRTDEVQAILRSDVGKTYMDDFRAIINVAEQRENGNVVNALAQVDRGGARMRLVIALAGLLLFAIGALLVITVRNAMAELRQSRDLTEQAHQRLLAEMGVREEAEAKVRQMQKMEAIGQLTGGVAHDFNNMLAVIISALQLAQRRLERGDTDIQRFIDAAMDGARRAATLTNRLLAFARRSPLTPAVIDINKSVASMSELLRRTLGESIQFETVLEAGLWRVQADVAEFENALLNICVNARDAMPEGGKLTVETANVFLDEAYARQNGDVTAGQYVMLAITDTGQGMSDEVKRQAFEPFFTTKGVGKGTGLGLSHVHGFVKQSGGHVAIYSEIGVGTTVKLYFPRTQKEETADAFRDRERLMPPPAGDPSIVILLVEDEERVRNLGVAALRELGYTVLHAANGVRALEILDANPGVRLLFTDVVMPEMSGRALADEALKRYPALKVVYTTGYTQNAIVHNGVVDADARLLLKPYTIDDLAGKIAAVLAE
ncbi:MAG: CHASE3 domain-containing protein [Hyphomonadaceae bacterium]|nr:CHASE3 domain-containing protein [Hyphomonadaceae bacterium]